ncbi:MAG: hypothetical protein RL764_1467 [Pseudomonadota bacterium]|jgi:hypothetical protein
MAGKRRYIAGGLIGLALGVGFAWHATGRGFTDGAVRNGPWSTSLSYGVASADALTRAAVARRGLLALPKTETVYWAATRDSAGALLDGNCTYRLSGKAVDSRWWSITLYDSEGYLQPNAARLWSFSGATLSAEEAEKGWQVTIAPTRPRSGYWLPSLAGQPFELTLRMYNPGPAFMTSPATAHLPMLTKESCA